MTIPATPAPATATTAAQMPVDAFINPFLLCNTCGNSVLWHKDDRVTNHPCGHVGVRSACMTWSPACGCICRERFQSVIHGPPAAVGPPFKPATGAKVL
jgi:hypothetical protein